jgi:hypothetical protein
MQLKQLLDVQIDIVVVSISDSLWNGRFNIYELLEIGVGINSRVS